MKIYDAFEDRTGAEICASTMKDLGVEIVQIKKINQGRLKYGVFLAGRNSSMYV